MANQYCYALCASLTPMLINHYCAVSPTHADEHPSIHQSSLLTHPHQCSSPTNAHEHPSIHSSTIHPSSLLTHHYPCRWAGQAIDKITRADLKLSTSLKATLKSVHTAQNGRHVRLERESDCIRVIFFESESDRNLCMRSPLPLLGWAERAQTLRDTRQLFP